MFDCLRRSPSPPELDELLRRIDQSDLPTDQVTVDQLRQALQEDSLANPFQPPMSHVLIWAFCSPVLRVGAVKIQQALSKIVQDRIKAQKAMIRTIACATARIEAWYLGKSILGSGFLARTPEGAKVLVTVGHVAHEFSDFNDQPGKRWKRKVVGGKRVLVAANFGILKGTSTEQYALVKNVLFAEQDTINQPDIAILELDDSEMRTTFPPPVSLNEAAVDSAANIFLVGFPDPLLISQSVSIPTKLRNVLKPSDNREQLQPGRIIKSTDNALYHDATTRTGNSGSPLVSFDSGRVVGLHVQGGEQSFANVAIPIQSVIHILRSPEISDHFSGSSRIVPASTSREISRFRLRKMLIFRMLSKSAKSLRRFRRAVTKKMWITTKQKASGNRNG